MPIDWNAKMMPGGPRRIDDGSNLAYWDANKHRYPHHVAQPRDWREPSRMTSPADMYTHFRDVPFLRVPLASFIMWGFETAEAKRAFEEKFIAS